MVRRGERKFNQGRASSCQRCDGTIPAVPVRGKQHLGGTIEDILVVANSVGWYIEEDILLLRQTQQEDEQIKIDGIGWQVKYKWHIGGMPHKRATQVPTRPEKDSGSHIGLHSKGKFHSTFHI